MIKTAAGLLARSLLEVGIVFLCLAGLLGYVSYRITRRLITSNPDRLELAGGKLAQGIGLVVGLRHLTASRLAAAGSVAGDDTGEPGDVLDWKQMVV